MLPKLLLSLALLTSIGFTTVSVNAQDTDNLLTGDELGLPELSITVMDDGWDLPDSFESGRYLVTATYEGSGEFGTAAFLRLPDGWSIDDLSAIFAVERGESEIADSDGTNIDISEEAATNWLYQLSFAGGVSASSDAPVQGIIDFFPGSWSVWDDTTEMAPQAFEVTGQMPSDLTDPEAAATISQVNSGDTYAIEISGDIQQGQNIIRIQNLSDSPHLTEFVGMSHLLEPEQVIALIETPDGEAPDPSANIPADLQLTFSSLYAGTQSSGTSQWLIGTFDDSNYLAACWIPDRDNSDHTHAEGGEFVLFEVP